MLCAWHYGRAPALPHDGLVLQMCVYVWVQLTARILCAELVTRKPDDFEIVGVAGLEVFVEVFETGELWGEAAF